MTEYSVEVNGENINLLVRPDGSLNTVNGTSVEYSIKKVTKQLYTIYNDTSSVDALIVEVNDGTVVLLIKGNYYFVNTKTKLERLSEELLAESAGGSHTVEIKSPMPGLILSLNCAEGDRVKKDDHLVVLEAMKMENIIKSPVDGFVKKVYKNVNDSLEKGDSILIIDNDM